MNAKEARKLSEKKNDPKLIARHVAGLLSCCHDEISRAAKIGHFSVRSPLDDLLRMCPVAAIKATEKELRKEGYGIGSSGVRDQIYW